MAATAADAQKVLSIGTLVNVSWKIGMAVTSSTCSKLNAPYVTLSLAIANGQGEVSRHTFEMSVPEFQNFAKNVQDMTALIDTI